MVFSWIKFGAPWVHLRFTMRGDRLYTQRKKQGDHPVPLLSCRYPLVVCRIYF